MSTRGLQQALARIYTDAKTREAFLSGNEAHLLIYDLSPNDLMHLRALKDRDSKRLSFFSGLLVNKQSNLVQILLPLTYRVLGESVWSEAWSTHVSTHSNEAMMSPLAKATRFLDYLESYFDHQSSDAVLAKDIISYERCKLSMRSAFQAGSGSQLMLPAARNQLENLYPLVQKPFLIRLFNYDLPEIIAFLNTSASLPIPRPTPTPVLFYRHWQTDSINTAKVAEWVEDLLNRCDGQTPANSIVEWLDKRAGISGGSSPSAQFLYRLEVQGVIALMNQPLTVLAEGHR